MNNHSLPMPVKLLIFTLVALILGLIMQHYTGTVTSLSGAGTGTRTETAVTETTAEQK